MASETTETPPTDTVEPVESTNLVEAVESTDPIESSETTDPVESAEPADTAKPTETAEPEKEKEEADEQDIGEWSDDELPPSGKAVPEAPVVEEEKMADDPSTKQDADTEKTTNRAPQRFEVDGDIPDFSKYRTNIPERLWRAKKADEGSEGTASPDIVRYEKEFQDYRKKMGILMGHIDDYATAMQDVVDKRNLVMQQYALMSQGTPLWERVGKPLSDSQMLEIENSGDLKTTEGIEARTHMITKVADDIGAGSVMAHQQLAYMQDEMNIIDFTKHTASYIDEWDDVISNTVDKQVKEVRLLASKRDHYLTKVDNLRAKVNKIEHKGKQVAPKKLSDQLLRNEQKLADADKSYDAMANGASVLIYEATARGWVDFYPVIKNVMKFEINRLGRESACYGSYHNTLAALKTDYREATKGTPDEPNLTSAL